MPCRPLNDLELPPCLRCIYFFSLLLTFPCNMPRDEQHHKDIIIDLLDKLGDEAKLEVRLHSPECSYATDDAVLSLSLTSQRAVT